jgi:hypothetical protein
MEMTISRRLAAINVPPLKRYNVRDDIRETLLAGMLPRLIRLVNITSSTARIPEEVSFCDGSSVTLFVMSEI